MPHILPGRSDKRNKPTVRSKKAEHSRPNGPRLFNLHDAATGVRGSTDRKICLKHEKFHGDFSSDDFNQHLLDGCPEWLAFSPKQHLATKLTQPNISQQHGAEHANISNNGMMSQTMLFFCHRNPCKTCSRLDGRPVTTTTLLRACNKQ